MVISKEFIMVVAYFGIFAVIFYILWLKGVSERIWYIKMIILLLLFLFFWYKYNMG